MDDIWWYMYGPVLVIALLGVIIIIIAVGYAKKKKDNAKNYQMKCSGAALVILSGTHPASNSWAENNSIITIDGDKANCFQYKIGIQACYIAPGTHTIVAKSSWGRRQERGLISLRSSEPYSMTVQIKPETHYSLNYNITNGLYVFEEYENERLFQKNEQSTSSQYPEEKEQVKSIEKYDDASWHYGGVYPSDLPDENGATHIGFFLQWCIEKDLTSDFMEEEFLEDVLKPVKAHTITGGEALWDALDGKFTSDLLNDEGNEFTEAYYNNDTKFAKKYGDYLSDYARAVNKVSETGTKYESIYHFEDTYEHYLYIKQIIDERFAQWNSCTDNF